jgi:hypothetical protein
MDYGRIFSRSWQLVWNNKFLLVLGFLAALGSSTSSSGGSGQANFQFSESDIPPGIEQNLERFLAALAPIAIGLLCVAFLVAIILWLVRLVSQAGLIGAAARLDAGEDVSLGSAFSEGVRYLWQMVGLNILLYLPLWIVGIVSAIGIFAAFGGAVAAAMSSNQLEGPAALGMTAAFAGICSVCCVLVILALIINVIYPFAQRGIVLGNLGVFDSIGHGWRVIRNNLGDVIMLIILFIVLGILFSFVVALVLLPLGFVALGPTFMGMIAGDAPSTGDIIYLVLAGLGIALISAIINSIYVTFRSVAVTLAYQEFIEKPKAV